MLKLNSVALCLVCLVVLSACATIKKIGDVQYRNHHLMFSEEEYQQSPGVLMRASVNAWNDYNLDSKVASLVDYYANPDKALTPTTFPHKMNFSLEDSDIFRGSQLGREDRPEAREIQREEALRHVHCLDEFHRGVSQGPFSNHRIPLFRVDTYCDDFLAENDIQNECIHWEIEVGEKVHNYGSDTVRETTLEAELVDKCKTAMQVISLATKMSHDFPDLSGTYDIVTGTNPNGGQYGGVVTITTSSEHRNRYCLKWDISNSNQEEFGCGDLKIDSGRKAFVLSVDWWSEYPVIYDVLDDGKLLIGTWHNGAGKESLKRR